MRTPRIFVETPLRQGTEVDLDERAARHVHQVLRLRPDDPLVLFDGAGADWSAKLTRADRDACRARIGSMLDQEPEAPRGLHLGLGVSRGERMDFAIQKAVELGVTAITPLLTRRGVVQLDGPRAAKRLAHWRGVVIAACEQSGRRRLPGMAPVTPLHRWLETLDSGLLLDHRAGQALTAITPPPGTIHLLVGPEGGLSDDERRLATASGLVAVRLGPRILRTETAPLAALASIQTLWGDFR
jgi:16S rRNA (uracil1498-N3)-methyltransferase